MQAHGNVNVRIKKEKWEEKEEVKLKAENKMCGNIVNIFELLWKLLHHIH